jgi:hypothetical protein
MNLRYHRKAVNSTSPLVESYKALSAREKKADGEVAAGLGYLRAHAGKMSKDLRTSALGWLCEHAVTGRVKEGDIFHFLLSEKADSTPPDDGVSPGDDTPTKPSKKKAKPKVTDDEEDAEEGGDIAEPVTHVLRGVNVTEDDVTAKEIEVGYLGTTANIAKQILYSGRKARGQVDPPARAYTGDVYEDTYQDQVVATARAIIDSGRRRRGEIE